jgi:hypothetical protein
MRTQIAAVMSSAILGFMVSSSLAVAQQRTAKACQEEWRANKAANQANGVTEKAYVARCRGGTTPTQPTAAPAAPPTGATAPTAAAPRVRPTATATGQKTIKACREEWQVNKAANQANGVTERAYVDQCRTGAAPNAAPSSPPAPAPAPTPTAAPAAPPPITPTATAPPARPAPAPTTTARPAPTNTGTPAAANEFATEAQAKARCPSDTVVWVTLKSGIYHFAGTRYYGTSKNGAYMCQGDTAAAGMRAAKNETHP